MRIKRAAYEPIMKAKVAAVDNVHDELSAVTASQPKKLQEWQTTK